MSGRLKLFEDETAALAFAQRSRAGDNLQVIRFGSAGWYLKKPHRPNIEPQFFCDDAHWRKYDAITDLPRSTARIAAGFESP